MPNPTIPLEVIEIIDQIDRRGSFAKAAEHLNKVPSALSYSIQRLEEQLGVTLFERHGRRSVMTAAGKHLLAEGRLLLDASARLADQTRELATGWEPRLRICLDTVIDFDSILPVIIEFATQHPHIELDISEEALGGNWERLVDDQIDLVIGGGPPVPVQSGISSLIWKEIDMVFALAADHPLAASDQPLTDKQLMEYPWVVVHDTSRYSAPRDTGRIQSDRRIYVKSIQQKIVVQLSGYGIGYLPRHRIESQLQQGQLVVRELVDAQPGTTQTLLAWKTVNRSKGLKALIKALQE